METPEAGRWCPCDEGLWQLLGGAGPQVLGPWPGEGSPVMVSRQPRISPRCFPVQGQDLTLLRSLQIQVLRTILRGWRSGLHNPTFQTKSTCFPHVSGPSIGSSPTPNRTPNRHSVPSSGPPGRVPAGPSVSPRTCGPSQLGAPVHHSHGPLLNTLPYLQRPGNQPHQEVSLPEPTAPEPPDPCQEPLGGLVS